jgi:hypothetical protein
LVGTAGRVKWPERGRKKQKIKSVGKKKQTELKKNYMLGGTLLLHLRTMGTITAKEKI